MSSEAITRNDLIAILNEVLPSVAVDYVAEQGTKDGWKYRKWNSGRIEAWVSKSVGSIAVTNGGATTYGGYRSNEQTIAIPSGIFTSTPNVIGNKAAFQGATIYGLRANSTTQISYFLGGCTASATVSSQVINIYAWQD